MPATKTWSAAFRLIDDTGERYVRMAHLASAGSHAINGVAALHTELLKQTVLQRLLRARTARSSST
jgi:starch phosphorylase